MSATDRGQPQERQQLAGFNLVGSMLSGLLGEPTRRGELAESLHGPTGFESVDDVDQVGVGIDAQDDAIVYERECSGEPLATTDGTGEEKVAPGDREGPDSSFTAPVVYLESPVFEAEAEVRSLVDGIGGCASQRRLGQQLGMNSVDPLVQGIEQRQRAPLAFFETLIGRDVSHLAVVLDCIEVGEVFQRNRGPPFFGQEGLMKLAADVHATAEPAFIGHRNLSLSVVIIDFTRVARVTIDLNETVNGRKPIGDFGSFPTLRVAVGRDLWRIHGAVGPHEAPDVAAERASFLRLVQSLQVRVVRCNDGRCEDTREDCLTHRLKQVGRVIPWRQPFE
jgi:hypothetical protein